MTRLSGLAALTPAFAVCVLYTHPDTEPDVAFRELCAFLGSGEVVGACVRSVADRVDGIGTMMNLGLDELYASVRVRRTAPAWGPGFIDVTHQVTIAVRRGALVFVHSDLVLRAWLRAHADLYRYLPAAVLRSLGHGDGLTVSSSRSHIYGKVRDMPEFLATVVATADRLDKAIAATPWEELRPQLAIPETDLGDVRGAYEVTVTDSELLRDAVLEVRGRPTSADFVLVIGHEGVQVGKLSIRPEPEGEGFGLDVRYLEPPSWPAKAQEIKDALDGDVLDIHYESGHTFSEFQINLVHRTAPPTRWDHLSVTRGVRRCLRGRCLSGRSCRWWPCGLWVVR